MAPSRRNGRSRGAKTVGSACEALEVIAPMALAEEWDHVGLLIGRRSDRVKRMLLTIDLTEGVLAEARRRRAEMVMTYHPPIFEPIARLTDRAAPIALAAAGAHLAVYSMHTALDVAEGGTNDVLAEAVGVVDAEPILAAAGAGECKIVTFVPIADVPTVSAAAFEAGAGRIGDYTECSFVSPGEGGFRGGAASNPTIGRRGRRETVAELRLEVIASRVAASAVAEAIRAAHSYETPAIDVYALEPLRAGVGMGRIGPLARPVGMKTFIARVKRATGVRHVLLAGPRTGRVARVAVGAGSCGGMWSDAVSAGADVFVTGEMRHHDALAAAAAGLTVICVGHTNSERPALPHVARRLRKALPGVEVFVSHVDHDPLVVV